MMRLNLVPSPHPEVGVSRFDEALFPEFRPLFEGTEASRFLPPGFRHDPSQASTVVVLENRSEKAITALRYRWDTVDASGTQRTSHTCSDIYSYNENEGSSRPSVIEPGVVEPGARKIISYYCMADKSEADAVRQGGGTASFLVTHTWDLADAVERTFAMDLIMFADGEISGRTRSSKHEALRWYLLGLHSKAGRRCDNARGSTDCLAIATRKRETPLHISTKCDLLGRMNGNNFLLISWQKGPPSAGGPSCGRHFH